METGIDTRILGLVKKLHQSVDYAVMSYLSGILTAERANQEIEKAIVAFQEEIRCQN